MAPMHEGKIVKPEVFNTLPENMRKEVEQKIEALQKELESDPGARAQVGQAAAAAHERAQRRGGQGRGARSAGRPCRHVRRSSDEVVEFLNAAGRDLIRNVGLFLAPGGEESEIVKQPADTARDARFRRYLVNVIVGRETARGGTGAPIIEELNPTYGNVIGRVEHLAQMGALVTDFLLIKPGALHKANGGYLLIDARKLLLSPFAWEALKRSIKAREIRIEQPSEMSGVVATQTLDPEPIPLDVKVILFGDRELYYLLSAARSRLFAPVQGAG